MTNDNNPKEFEIDPTTGLPKLPPNYIFSVEKFNPKYILSLGKKVIDEFYVTLPSNGNEYYAVAIYQVSFTRKFEKFTYEPSPSKFWAFLGATVEVPQFKLEPVREKCISRSKIVKQIHNPLSAIEVPDYIKEEFIASDFDKKVVYDAREFSKELVFKHACLAYEKWEEYIKEENRTKELEKTLLGDYPPKELS